MSPFDREVIAGWIVFGILLATMWWCIYHLFLLVSEWG